jgi:hypothetical protein
MSDPEHRARCVVVPSLRRIRGPLCEGNRWQRPNGNSTCSRNTLPPMFRWRWDQGKRRVESAAYFSSVCQFSANVEEEPAGLRMKTAGFPTHGIASKTPQKRANAMCFLHGVVDSDYDPRELVEVRCLQVFDCECRRRGVGRVRREEPCDRYTQETRETDSPANFWLCRHTGRMPAPPTCGKRDCRDASTTCESPESSATAPFPPRSCPRRCLQTTAMTNSVPRCREACTG